jgi:6-phosphogluconolactonase (cycloisomerase 2 family)
VRISRGGCEFIRGGVRLSPSYKYTEADKSVTPNQPDNRYLIASLRNDSSFNIPSPVNSSTTIPSDSLLTYAIDRNSGRLELVQAVPAGGSSPRQFSLNAAGDRVAVAVQTNGWVAIFERDVESGKIGKLLAVKGGLGENGVVCVQWDERTG